MHITYISQYPYKKMEVLTQPLNLDLSHNFAALSLETKTFVTKSEFEQIIDRIHNLLYRFGITGQKALNDIVNVMFMFQIDKMCRTGKLVLPSLQNVDPNTIECKMFRTTDGFSQFLNNDDDIMKLLSGFHRVARLSELQCYFPGGLILHSHAVSNTGLIRNLMIEIHNMIFTKEMKDYDPNGILYEKMINGYLNERGSKLGQFFTPRVLVDRVIDEISDFVYEMVACQDEKKPLKIFDPFMGTGGFLTHAFNKFKIKLPDIELYGSDIEPDTFKYGLMNALITTGELKFGNFTREDSIRKPSIFNNVNGQMIPKTYDIVLTNPPFGLKFKLDEIGYKESKDSKGQITSQVDIEQYYCRVPTTSGSFHALQLCMFSLSPNGICAIVLPRGQEVNGTGRNHKNFIQVRQALVEKYNLLKILDCPKDTFEHTSVETTVLIFTHGSTTGVEFKSLKTNTSTTIKIEDLRTHTYSFDINVYIKKEKLQTSKYFELKKLGEVIEILSCGKHKSDEGVDKPDEKNIYPLFYCSILGHKYSASFDDDGEICVINKTNGSGKSMIYYYNGKYAVANTTIRFRSNSNVLTKYIYYYLLNHINLLEDKYTGLNQKSITNEDFLNMEIPIPTLETQKDLIQKFDVLSNERKRIRDLQIDLDNNIKELIENYHPINGAETKKISELCELNKGKVQSSKTSTDDNKLYRLITLSEEHKSTNCDTFSLDGENIFVSDTPSGKKFVLKYYHGKCEFTDLLLNLRLINNINCRYLYYWLQNYILPIAYEDYMKGLANKSLDKEKFLNIDIPVPSEEDQLKIVKFYEQKEKEINYLKQTMQDLDKLYDSTYLVARSYF